MLLNNARRSHGVCVGANMLLSGGCLRIVPLGAVDLRCGGPCIEAVASEVSPDEEDDPDDEEPDELSPSLSVSLSLSSLLLL